METKALFQKSLGLGSDIVTHEMFHFEDAGSHAIALRPEGTASVARCFINNSFPLPKKFFYAGPMFRHEKPQKGRSREFYQFGIELFGSSQARSDAEVLDLAWNLLKNFQVTDQVQVRFSFSKIKDLYFDNFSSIY